MGLAGKTIAVLGGTGAEGSGLAFRWAYAGLSVVIGSRDGARAQRAAAELGGLLGVFSHFSAFIAVYALGSVIQRYFDSRFQAQGRIGDFFLLPLAPNVIRLLLLLVFWQFPLFASPSDLAWSAAAAGILCSQVLFLLRHPIELSPFLHTGHLQALRRLWNGRDQYLAYYPNIVLKRLRDTAMPLVCDFFAADRFEAGKYLLAYRGVDFSIGQLRVIESFFSNAGLRSALKQQGGLSLLLLAVFGQLAAIVAGLLLVGQRHAVVDRERVLR